VVETRPIDGVLHVHPEIDDVEQRLNRAEHLVVAARAADVALALAEDRGQQRWVVFLGPLPDRFRDGDLRDLRSAAMRGRAAFGPKDSIRDVLPAEVTEPLLEAVDRLLRELNRYDRTTR